MAATDGCDFESDTDSSIICVCVCVEISTKFSFVSRNRVWFY